MYIFIDKRSLTPKKSVKRMCYVGDFKLSDLDSPRKRRCYWRTTVKNIKMYKQKLNAAQKKNRRLLKKIKNLNDLANHLKENKFI